MVCSVTPACVPLISADKTVKNNPKRPWGRPYLAAGTAAFLLWPSLSWAQAASDAAQTPQENPSFVIKGFDVVGENPLSASEVSQLLAPYLRIDATMETLQGATQTLEAALKAHGYVLHRVALPPQEVGDRVTLSIVKFVIGKVLIEGASRLDDANIRASMPELREGTAPNFQTLAIQTAIANESQGKQVQISLKESEEPDQIDARVVVKEARPWNFSVSATNTGSAATGNDRVTMAGGHSNVLNLDHQVTLAYTTSAERSSDVKQLGVNYRVPMYRWGGVVGVSYTQSDVQGDFGAFKSTGAGQTSGINYSHYLAPVGGFRSFITVGLDSKQFDVTKINGEPLAGQALRRSRPLSLGYSARLESDASFWNYNAEVAVNVPGDSGNSLAAYRTEDTRITTANWSALRGSGNYVSSLGAGWLWGVRGQFQFSSDALISGEQFGAGGAQSVRGLSERPLSGDSGLAAGLEVTTYELAPGLRGLAFLDAAWLSSNSPNASKPASDSVASSGLGLRYAKSNLSLTADYGRVVMGSSIPISTGAVVPKVGDDRLHLSLTARF